MEVKEAEAIYKLRGNTWGKEAFREVKHRGKETLRDRHTHGASRAENIMKTVGFTQIGSGYGECY